MSLYIPKRGERFTISANTKTGDRSYTDNILECIEANDLTIFAIKLTGWSMAINKDVTLVISEHKYSPVSEFTLRRVLKTGKAA